MSGPPDPRLILREDELDPGPELMLLAEGSLWAAVDQGLAAEGLDGVAGARAILSAMTGPRTRRFDGRS